MAPAEVLGQDRVEAMAFTSRDGVSTAKFKADDVVFAIGQKTRYDSNCSCKVNEKGEIKATKSGKTNLAKVLAGDVLAEAKLLLRTLQRIRRRQKV